MSDTLANWRSQTGAALAGAMLVTLLMAAVMVSVASIVATDVQSRQMDGARTQSFYSAQAGLEKLTADLGNLFSANVAPTGAAINALTVTPPALADVTWVRPDGASGYRVTFPADVNGNPTAAVQTVQAGPFQGLIGLSTQYQMDVTSKLNDGSETNLTRTLQTVSIPVFQFGMFSENDLSFFAGPVFNFGGRVHSNSNLYLASGATLTMSDKVTAVGEIVRTNLSNGWPTSSNYTGNVRIIRAPNAFRDLLSNEGSLVGTLGSAVNEPKWTNLSTGTYNHNIGNGRTGARRLDLPFVSFGAAPIDLIRRPPVNEDVANPQVLSQRFFTMASVRILLSDTAGDITGLPTVTATAPIPLGNLAVTPVAGYTVNATHPPFAVSPGSGTTGVKTSAGTPVIGGFIKIELQNQAGVWQDVTLEVLNLGVADRQWADPATNSPNCADPNPNAIIRFERLKDNNDCSLNGSVTATNYVPNVLYDTREGVLRDGTADNAPLQFGGIMHYVELDVNNLRRWILGNIGATGTNAQNVNGFTVYFSDRRGNRNAAGAETGEYGFEDIVNPGSAAGTPNGILDTGEDLNGNGTLDIYGETPQLIAGMTAPLDATARPWTNVDPANALNATTEQQIARRNPPIFFRRALKLINGSLGNIVSPGLTVASENPVYVQGNWNANNAGFGNPHVATAILADAVTLLSNAWSDRESFIDPHNQTPRQASTTWYRFAVIAGKGLSFPRPLNMAQDFGTDGGAHNFLRYLENWGGQTLNFRGSIATMFTSRQAVGTYKCCEDVYSPPTRGYNFDADFLVPSLLPPRTPMFRDVNITGFAQLIRPR
jgi:hypothetical protein